MRTSGEEPCPCRYFSMQKRARRTFSYPVSTKGRSCFKLSLNQEGHSLPRAPPIGAQYVASCGQSFLTLRKAARLLSSTLLTRTPSKSRHKTSLTAGGEEEEEEEEEGEEEVEEEGAGLVPGGAKVRLRVCKSSVAAASREDEGVVAGEEEEKKKGPKACVGVAARPRRRRRGRRAERKGEEVEEPVAPVGLIMLGL